MNKRSYVKAMKDYGFPKEEAEKMGNYALLDFDSYDEALAYFSNSERFLRGQVYANHRKARRPFVNRRK